MYKHASSSISSFLWWHVGNEWTCMHQLWGNAGMVMPLSYLSGGQQLEYCVKRTIILVRCHHHCREQVFIHVDFIVWIGWAFWSVLCRLRVLLSSLCSCSFTSLQQFFILQFLSSNDATTMHQPHYPWEVTFLKNTIDDKLKTLWKTWR
jgi:hypothetical protein